MPILPAIFVYSVEKNGKTFCLITTTTIIITPKLEGSNYRTRQISSFPAVLLVLEISSYSTKHLYTGRGMNKVKTII